MKPYKAKGYRIEDDGSCWGYGDKGYVVGGGVRLVLEGPANRVSNTAIQKRIRALIEAHIDELVEIAPLTGKRSSDG